MAEYVYHRYGTAYAIILRDGVETVVYPGDPDFPKSLASAYEEHLRQSLVNTGGAE